MTVLTKRRIGPEERPAGSSRWLIQAGEQMNTYLGRLTVGSALGIPEAKTALAILLRSASFRWYLTMTSRQLRAH